MTTRHYLLTWYGLTDLRAALGIDDSSGPILSALKTGDYTDVVILAFTDAKKTDSFSGSLRQEWEEWVTSPGPERVPPSREQAFRLIDAISNTAAAHDLFGRWLKFELDRLGVAVTVEVVPHVLERLNDAKGIYAAATAAVRLAVEDSHQHQVTTYVSPGTPVMAYTWALIARSNPQLNIGVISSSDPRMPPEQIDLPSALLDSSIRAHRGSEQDHDRYALVIHLLGEQALPVFFGLRQFQADRNLILTTKEYEEEARRLAKSVSISPSPIIVPDPFKPADTRKAIAKQVAKLPADARVAVNMTGGTKLMFAGALSACWELSLDPFYFEIRNHNVLFLRDGSHVPFVGISDVEDFLRAGDFATVNDGRWPADPDSDRNRRLPIAEELWRRRDSLRGLYASRDFLNSSSNRPGYRARQQNDGSPFSFTWRNGEASAASNGSTRLVVDEVELDVPRKGFLQFISGGWVEEHVFALLRPLEAEGVVRDVRVGFVAGYRRDSSSEQEKLAQEFDCVFTDGRRLWIVECKAGLVTQEAIQKLENNLRLYGGVAARGIFVSARPLSESSRNRLGKLPSITAIEPDELSSETLKRVILRAST